MPTGKIVVDVATCWVTTSVPVCYPRLFSRARMRQKRDLRKRTAPPLPCNLVYTYFLMETNTVRKYDLSCVIHPSCLAEGDFLVTEGRIERNGTGTQHFVDGDVYTGQWKNDKMNGKGKI